jgi:hypothetical protein
MQFGKSLITVSALSLIMLGNAGAAGKPERLQHLFGDLNTAEGLEVAVPFIKFNNLDAGGYPASITMSWRVYTAGTATLLHTSTPKTYLTPPIPSGCSSSDFTGGKWFDWEYDMLSARRQDELKWDGGAAIFNAGGKRAHIALNISVDCSSNGIDHLEAGSGAVYSGRLDATEKGTEWVRRFNNVEIMGLNGVDQTSDLINDAVMITTISWLANSDIGTNASIYFVNAGTGSNTTPTAQPAPRTYPLTR